MDVEINAYGKQVKVFGLECDAAIDCLETAYDFWDSIEDPRNKPAPVEDESERPVIQASGGGHHERKYQPMGYAFLGDGERLNVQ